MGKQSIGQTTPDHKLPRPLFSSSLRHIWSLGFLAYRRKQRSRELLVWLIAWSSFSLVYLYSSLLFHTHPAALVILFCKRREEHLSATCRNHRAPTALSLSSSSSKLPRPPRPLSRSSRSVVCGLLRYVFLSQAPPSPVAIGVIANRSRHLCLRAMNIISNGLLHSTPPSRTLPCPPMPPVTTASP